MAICMYLIGRTPERPKEKATWCTQECLEPLWLFFRFYFYFFPRESREWCLLSYGKEKKQDGHHRRREKRSCWAPKWRVRAPQWYKGCIWCMAVSIYKPASALNVSACFPSCASLLILLNIFLGKVKSPDRTGASWYAKSPKPEHLLTQHSHALQCHRPRKICRNLHFAN